MYPGSKGSNMASTENKTKNKWVFSLLWVNLAVVLVALVLLVANQISSVRELLHTLAYANSTGLLGTWVLGGLAERFYLRKSPPVAAVAVAILVFAAFGCLLAQA